MAGEAEMRPVYINGRFLTQKMTGVQRYAHEIVRALDKLLETRRGDTVEVCLLAPPGAAFPELSNIRCRTVGMSSGHLWDQVDFAWAAREGVALCLASTGPVLHPRCLVAIHDAAIYRIPDAFSARYRLAHKALGQILARTATLITVSEFSRSELSQIFGVASDTIMVAPNGHEHLQISPDAQIIEKLGLTNTPFFVMVGSLTRNKNLAVAVKALNRLPPGSAKLVAVGDHKPSVFGHVPLPSSADLIAPGRLEDPEIAALLQQATAFVFPSLYEGFGIPPLEAMANNCPVFASTAEAVAETCGDAADYFCPHDDEQLADLYGWALADWHSDRTWREIQAGRGERRLAHYQWRTSAKRILNRCEAIAGGATRHDNLVRMNR
jgi:glycosyltransferase involved in cell wall biosynthesis